MIARIRGSRVYREVVFAGVAAAIGVGAFATVKHRRVPAPIPIARAFPFESGDSNRLRAFIVVNSEDCSGNLGFIVLFQRDTSRVRLSRLYFRGPRNGLAATTSLLRRQGIETPLVEETTAVRNALIELGATGTPFLVVLDADDVVRLGMVSPPDIDTFVQFPKLLRSVWEQGVSDPLKAR